jgi:hypothetical protein
LTTRSATILLAAGGNVTCTFINVAQGGIIPPPPVIPPTTTTSGGGGGGSSQVGGASSSASSSPSGLISEVAGVRSLPATGNGGYLADDHKWDILIAVFVFSFIFLVGLVQARKCRA